MKATLEILAIIIEGMAAPFIQVLIYLDGPNSEMEDRYAKPDAETLIHSALCWVFTIGVIVGVIYFAPQILSFFG